MMGGRRRDGRHHGRLIVVFAEKPSVARELASFLGATQRHDGYYECRGYQVTWALGHLVTLKEPQDYDPALKHWSLESLPFVPERFGLKPLAEKGAGKQLAVVRRLFRTADELIPITDADSQGNLDQGASRHRVDKRAHTVHSQCATLCAIHVSAMAMPPGPALALLGREGSYVGWA